jgi:hypothetical protein
VIAELIPDMANQRREFGITQLNNGDILVAGGFRSQSSGPIAGAERFTP